jgi:transposase-like protein
MSKLLRIDDAAREVGASTSKTLHWVRRLGLATHRGGPGPTSPIFLDEVAVAALRAHMATLHAPRRVAAKAATLIVEVAGPAPKPSRPRLRRASGDGAGVVA